MCVCVWSGGNKRYFTLQDLHTPLYWCVHRLYKLSLGQALRISLQSACTPSRVSVCFDGWAVGHPFMSCSFMRVLYSYAFSRSLFASSVLAAAVHFPGTPPPPNGFPIESPALQSASLGPIYDLETKASRGRGRGARGERACM